MLWALVHPQVLQLRQSFIVAPHPGAEGGHAWDVPVGYCQRKRILEWHRWVLVHGRLKLLERGFSKAQLTNLLKLCCFLEILLFSFCTGGLEMYQRLQAQVVLKQEACHHLQI